MLRITFSVEAKNKVYNTLEDQQYRCIPTKYEIEYPWCTVARARPTQSLIWNFSNISEKTNITVPFSLYYARKMEVQNPRKVNNGLNSTQVREFTDVLGNTVKYFGREYKTDAERFITFDRRFLTYVDLTDQNKNYLNEKQIIFLIFYFVNIYKRLKKL